MSKIHHTKSIQSQYSWFGDYYSSATVVLQPGTKNALSFLNPFSPECKIVADSFSAVKAEETMQINKGFYSVNPLINA